MTFQSIDTTQKARYVKTHKNNESQSKPQFLFFKGHALSYHGLHSFQATFIPWSVCNVPFYISKDYFIKN